MKKSTGHPPSSRDSPRVTHPVVPGYCRCHPHGNQPSETLVSSWVSDMHKCPEDDDHTAADLRDKWPPALILGGAL